MAASITRDIIYAAKHKPLPPAFGFSGFLPKNVKASEHAVLHPGKGK
jgi:hypothetical protein